METDELGHIKLPITGILQDDDSSQINISDVIEVIQTTDPTSALAMFNPNAATGSVNNGGDQQQQQQFQQPTANNVGDAQQHQQTAARNIRRKAYVKITEQPAGKALRFRYECEGRSAGSIPGVNSTPENKTFPTIEIIGYKGRAVVVVSCVTKDPPYRPHPHNLVGKEGCKKGVCTLEINSETMRAVFSNLGIQCVKKKDIENALRAREEIRVDPFKTGFSHRFQPSSIDLNSVRLCFQVFLESDQKGRFTVPLPPVVSDPIYDKKAMSDLVICTLCSCTSTVSGGKEIILLCEKVAKEDISVRFFEEQDGQLLWEGYGDFQHTDVHKQTAIKFKTPRYKTLEVEQPVKVYIQLRRPSDGATSEPLPFDYLPLDSDPAVLKRKRQKFGGDANIHLFRHINDQQPQKLQKDHQNHDGRYQQSMDFLNIATGTSIKAEPRDPSPLPQQQQHHNMFGNTYRMPENSPSPQPLSSPAPMYNPSSNTPSPYSIGQQAGGNLISPNSQYGIGGGNISPNINMDVSEFSYQQQQQQQQQQSQFDNYNNQLQQQMRQQQNQWNLTTQQTQNMKQQELTINNINSGNFNVDNLLTNQNQQHHNDQQWNLSTNINIKQQLSTINNLNTNNFNVNNILTNTPGQNQQQHQQSQLSANLSLSEAPNLSSLLDMDSEQLIQFNSAELSGLSLS